MKRTFLITSLVAAGFGRNDPLASSVVNVTAMPNDGPDNSTLFGTFRQDHQVTLADHRSHRSHSSHSSHRSSGGGHSSHSSHTSHRSSTGGYSYDPIPIYTPPPSPPSPPRSPSGSSSGRVTTPPSSLYYQPDNAASASASSPTLKSLPGRSELFKKIAKRVQIALLAQGLFDGPINGVVGPQTRHALRAYQARFNLEQTGTITPETLDSMKIPSE